MGQLGIFDVQDRLCALSKMGDPLEKLDEAIDWEDFRQTLTHGLKKDRREATAGRKPYDPVMKFKILVLQDMYGISDHQMEFQIRDRLTFMRFLDLGVEDRIPDEKTIWLFREQLTKKGLVKKLFKRFNKFLDRHGFHAKKGTIIDASLIDVPVQRNTRDENVEIKKGDVPKDWEKEGNESKRRQKDVDAAWTKKNGKKFYGYKDHVSIDAKHKIIRKFEVTPANTHDSQVFEDLLDRKNTSQQVYADSAYSSAKQRKSLKRKKIEDQVCRKGVRNKPLSDCQIKTNHRKSKTRCRIEHIFGFMVNSMQWKIIRCIGLVRARTRLGMKNLVYNLCRYRQITSFA